MKSTLVTALLLLSQFALLAQIQSGPMHGHIGMREALIWVQTVEEAEVAISYRSMSDELGFQKTPFQTSEQESAFTLKFELTNLNWGTEYEYFIQLDEGGMMGPYTFTTQDKWKYSAKYGNHPPDFTLMTGSCNFINELAWDRPGKPYGKSPDIFKVMATAKPDLMLWLGDNIYLREPDFGSRSSIHHRYTHTRSIPEIQEFLRVCPHYAIWDDHDFGPNDSNGSYIHKDWTLEAFQLFWGNPSFGLPDLEGGITTQFQYADIDFFLLDNRYYRSSHSNKEKETCIWGEEQIDWLIEALKFSKSPFKIIATGGQFLSNFAEYENHALYAKERKYVLKRLKEENIRGVIFLSGDRHHTELSRMDLGRDNQVYDLTASPLTSSAYDHSKEPNKYRVPGTVVGTQNYACLRFEGDNEQRVCIVQIFDAFGNLQWEERIPSW